MKRAQKAISWRDLLIAIDVGKSEDFPLENASTIKPLISSRIKDKFPDRKYKTDATSKPNILVITRER